MTEIPKSEERVCGFTKEKFEKRIKKNRVILETKQSLNW